MPFRPRSGGSIELSSQSALLLAVFHPQARLTMAFAVAWRYSYLIEAILRRLWHQLLALGDPGTGSKPSLE
jgi:hypothetical protein